MKCCHCHKYIHESTYSYSTYYFGLSFCMPCQEKFKNYLSKGCTKETLKLFIELKNKDIPVELEKYDGYKTIDIAIVSAKLNIEVDGHHHNTNPQQALSDLQRTYYSAKKGYDTVRVPNSLIRHNFDGTVEMVVLHYKLRCQELSSSSH